ncbi:LOW QUALITY PROTEIN: tetratricopeptide repeat protein 17-like [Amphiura filiformis]|uniref:LOW QUALITY PROTEIN: tetratricopeptide repeat protein 17-like n=1 Tax=Amphiura filiformis TaxID=82378 RepID=UPI003B212A4B
MAVCGTRNFSVLLAAVLLWLYLPLSFGSTHWVVTEEGLITQQVNSEFNLKEPYDLITFMKQESRSHEVHQFEKVLEYQKTEIEKNEDKDPDLEQRFLKTDPDCMEAGIALTDIDLYTKTVMSLENKGIRAVDHINLELPNPKKYRKPNCTKIFDLPFSMHAYDHLERLMTWYEHINLELPNPKKYRKPNCTKILDLPFSMHAYDHLEAVQERKNLSSVAEPDLIYLLPADEGLDRIGYLIYKALKQNKTSWVLYNFASYFWRVHGNAEQVIDCARKALHFAPHAWKNVALLNMANALHRAHYSTDAAILGEAALEGDQDLEVIYFMLGNIYAALGQYSRSIARFKQALALSPDLSVAEKRMYAVMCHQKLEKALEAQHTSLQRTLSELRDYQVKQEHLQELQKVVKKSRRNPDEQYESNLSFHHTKLLQGFTADKTNCELTEVGFETHFYVCKQDSYPQGEVFGQPLETAVIEAADTRSIHNNCIRLPNGEENCFNLSTGPSSQIGYNSYLSPPRHGTTLPWHSPDWPSTNDCNEITGGLPDWFEFAPTHLAPENKGLNKYHQIGYNSYLSPPRHGTTLPWHSPDWPSTNDCNEITGGLPDWFEFAPTHLAPENKGLNVTPTVTDYLSLKPNEMMMLPWFSPVCVTVEPIDEGDTAMDYVDGVAQRTKLPLTDTLDSLKKIFLGYGCSDYINVDEMGHRVLTSLEENKEPNMKWMLYNLGGLYWQISGNNYHGIECLRRALYHTPIEYADIPLVNAASVMLRLKRPQDAIQLLRMALVVNSTEPMTHFTLGNALAAQKNYSQAAQQYKLALNFNPDYTKALEALKVIKCHLKQPDRLCPLENDAGKEYAHGVNNGHESGDVGKSMRSAEGNVQRESRTVCQHVNGKRECKTETRSRTVDNDGACSDGSENKKERKGEREEKGKQRKSADGVQKPPQAPSHGTGQMNGSGQMHKVEEPRKIIEKQVFNVRMLEPLGAGKGVMFDIKDIVPQAAPNHAMGPQIPAAPAPGIDLSKLLHSTQLPWPSAEECQHFKRLNLRAFYSTWVSVEAKDVRIDDYVDFGRDPGGDSGLDTVPLCWSSLGTSMHMLDHLEAMGATGEFAEQGLRDVLLTLGGRQAKTMEEIGSRIALSLKTHSESWVPYNLAALYWRVQGHVREAVSCLRVALYFSPQDKKDIALISLANIFHASGFYDDGITVAKYAVEIAPELVINHFTLANVYSAKGWFDDAIQYYESTLLLQPEFQPAIERLKTIQCNILQWMDGNPPSAAKEDNDQ